MQSLQHLLCYVFIPKFLCVPVWHQKSKQVIIGHTSTHTGCNFHDLMDGGGMLIYEYMYEHTSPYMLLYLGVIIRLYSAIVHLYLFYDGSVKYKLFWHEVSVESLILRWLLAYGPLVFSVRGLLVCKYEREVRIRSQCRVFDTKVFVEAFGFFVCGICLYV